ncbi:MAG: hypothetical protein HY927_03400 [Elusimicrobia bacterium]|nr:hypothetical protein [Elusimicrobiota bacterium]
MLKGSFVGLSLLFVLPAVAWPASGERRTASDLAQAGQAELDYRRLKEEPEAADGATFFAVSASLGSGRKVTGRVTFDRRKAAAGGWVFAAASASPEDGQAIRMSEAVLASGGLLSSIAVAARERAVPALLVERARWGGPPEPFLELERAVLGEGSSVRGFQVRLAQKTVPQRIKEGDVVVLDPEAGTLTVPTADMAPVLLEAAAALKAYDGLKDGQALVQWLDAVSPDLAPASRLELGARLVSEMADRAGGAAGVDSLSKVRAAAERMLDSDGRAALRAAERKVFSRQVRRTLRDLDEAQSELGSAPPSWAARLCRQAEGRWERIGLLASAFRLASPASAQARHQGLRRLCGKQAKAEPPAPSKLQEALRRAGVKVPGTARLPAGMYRRFVKEAGLEERIGTVMDDPSLLLRQRSARIRDLLRAAEVPESLEREMMAGIPSAGPQGSWALLVPGSGPFVLRPGDLSPVKEYWASLWSPGRLAQRKKEGRGVLDSEAEVDLIRLEACERSATLLSRDPASGKARMTVSAAYGEIEGVLSGRASPDQYTLGRNGREVLPAIVGLKLVMLERDARGRLVERALAPDAAARRVLAAPQLESLAAAARALEGHYGWGVEMSACFAGGELSVLGSSPIDRLLSAD